VKLVFFGTPEFAVPSLEALARVHEIALVVAQPDKPAGRGMKMQAPAIAVKAKELGLPLEQPSKIRDAAFLDRIQAVAPAAGIVIAYGRILPGALLEIPHHGFLNVHGSVLPRWRGAAPIQRAIEAGDRSSGVTLMRIDEQLDHGPILAIEETPINPHEHTPDLARRLAQIGANALLPVLDQLQHGTAVETEQDHDAATHAAKIEKREGLVDWALAARVLYDRYRAFDPWPGLFFEVTGETIKLYELSVVDGDATPGTLLAIEPDGVTIATGSGALHAAQLQRPGKPRAAAADVARALGWQRGQVIA
jgi:methionyl-tRNA formyltransferase